MFHVEQVFSWENTKDCRKQIVFHTCLIELVFDCVYSLTESMFIPHRSTKMFNALEKSIPQRDNIDFALVSLLLPLNILHLFLVLLLLTLN